MPLIYLPKRSRKDMESDDEDDEISQDSEEQKKIDGPPNKKRKLNPNEEKKGNTKPKVNKLSSKRVDKIKKQLNAYVEQYADMVRASLPHTPQKRDHVMSKTLIWGCCFCSFRVVVVHRRSLSFLGVFPSHCTSTTPTHPLIPYIRRWTRIGMTVTKTKKNWHCTTGNNGKVP